MSHTDLLVAVCGANASPLVPSRSLRRIYHSKDMALVKLMLQEPAGSRLIVMMLDSLEEGREINTVMFEYFADGFSTKSDGHLQFSVSFVEESDGDVVEYHCERRNDIGAVMKEESGMHRCGSICATTVCPTSNSFEFTDEKLSVMTCTDENYDNEALVSAVEAAAASLSCAFTHIILYYPSEAMLLRRTPTSVLDAFHKTCQDRVFGHHERVSLYQRLREVREWTQMVAERAHFAPTQAGPYFVNLNPHLIVEEKLAHAIQEGTTYLVEDGSNASAVDFVVQPRVTAAATTHHGVYSPHVRVRREGSSVWISSECGMTYVNGQLLSRERRLQHNDRIIISTQLIFRFVLVSKKPLTNDSAKSSSRVLDWELCAREFREQTAKDMERCMRQKLQDERDELSVRCAALEEELDRGRGNSWLILTNPPARHQGQVMWPLNTQSSSCELTIGPQGSVTLPFLTNTGCIRKDADLLIFVSGSDVVQLSDCSRFTLGPYCFLISLCRNTSPRVTRGESLFTMEEVNGLQQSSFDLQWSLASLFDFAFPQGGRDTEDCLKTYRDALYADDILTADQLYARDVSELHARLTQAVRMIGAGLAEEVNRTSAHGASSLSNRPDKGGLTSDQLRLFKSAVASKDLSAKLWAEFNAEIGKALLQQAHGSSGDGHALHPDFGAGTTPHTTCNVGKQTSSVKQKLEFLRGTCLIPSVAVMRSANSVVTILSTGTAPRALWSKYVKSLQHLWKASSCKIGADSSVESRQSLLFGVVDVALSSDLCLNRNLLSSRDVAIIEERIDTWQHIAESCVDVYLAVDGPNRSTWRHEVSVERKSPSAIRQGAAKTNVPCHTPICQPSQKQQDGSRAIPKRSASSSSRQRALKITVPPAEAKCNSTQRSRSATASPQPVASTPASLLSAEAEGTGMGNKEALSHSVGALRNSSGRPIAPGRQRTRKCPPPSPTANSRKTTFTAAGKW